MKQVNGYTVDTFYAGLVFYTFTKNGEVVYCGCNVDEIINRFGFNPNEI